ncbi:MAG: hypothetical protein HYU99_04245, partial [Deltaproteobacteria bacterium]|nr:hypothetical protein [Deltaproteobacteria bacterium]
MTAPSSRPSVEADSPWMNENLVQDSALQMGSDQGENPPSKANSQQLQKQEADFVALEKYREVTHTKHRPPLLFLALDQLIGCESVKEAPVPNIDPTAAILAPQESEFMEGEEITFEVQGSDDQDEAESLEYTLSSSVDGLLSEGNLDQKGRATIMTTLGAGDHTIELEVFDSEGASGVDTLEMTVMPNQAPEIEILAPAEGEAFYEGQLISLEVQVSDEEDAPELLSVSWESDLDGPLVEDIMPDSNGLATTEVYLHKGDHLLRATVTDSLEKTKTATVTVTIGAPNNLPECEITAPESGSAYGDGEVVYFEGQVSDADEANAGDLNVAWESDKDGVI